MAGHSKWKNIQHRKGAQDAKRGKLFTKMAKEITVAAKMGGDDLDGNPRLRAAVIKARSNSMPKDNIDRAIKKGAGDIDGSEYLEKTYEGYGPSGTALIVECLTDNINRTVADVRHCFTRFGGNLGTDGSVSWMFQTKGSIIFEKSKVPDFDSLFEISLENGAEEVNDEDEEIYEITCKPENYLALRDAIESLKLEPDVSEITRTPENFIPLVGDKVQTFQKLIDMLEDNDDVQNVYHNAEIEE